jgi:hypothetical protein
MMHRHLNDDVGLTSATIDDTIDPGALADCLSFATPQRTIEKLIKGFERSASPVGPSTNPDCGRWMSSNTAEQFRVPLTALVKNERHQNDTTQLAGAQRSNVLDSRAS